MSENASPAELQQEVFNLKMIIHEYENKLKDVGLNGLTGDSLYKEVHELRIKVTEKDAEIKNLTEVCVGTREVLERFQKIIATKSAELDTTSQQNTTLSSKITQLEQELVQKSLSLADKDRQITELTSKTLRYDKYRAELLSRNQQITKLESELSSLKSTSNDAQKKVAQNFTFEIEKLKIAQKLELDDLKLQLSQTHSTLTHKSAQLDKYHSEITLLREETITQRKKLDETSRTIAELTSQLACHEDKKLLEQEQLITTYTKANEQLEREMKEALNDEKRKTGQALLSSKKSLTEMKTRLAGLERERDLETAALKSRISELKSEITSVREKWYMSIKDKSKSNRAKRSSSANPCAKRTSYGSTASTINDENKDLNSKPTSRARPMIHVQSRFRQPAPRRSRN